VAVEDFESLFFKGEGVESAEVCLASILWKFPKFKRRGWVSLPRCRRSLVGWKKIHPMKSRRPLPRFALSLVCHRLAQRQRRRLALGVWLGM